MDDLRSTSARIFYDRYIRKLHHHISPFSCVLVVRLSVGWRLLLPAPGFAFASLCVRRCPPGLPGLVRPSGGVWLLGGSLVAFVPAVGWRWASGRGSALFTSPTGVQKSAFCIIGKPITSPTRGYKTRLLYKQGFAFLGLVAVGLVFRGAVAGRRAVAAFFWRSFGLSGLFGVRLCRGLVFGSRRHCP